uniref:Uncharacterized protein n=1 Tax=Arundo donax TaxID=35708 RepID=A0A0A9SRE4_ARUDO
MCFLLFFSRIDVHLSSEFIPLIFQHNTFQSLVAVLIPPPPTSQFCEVVLSI